MGSCLSRASMGGFQNPIVNVKTCEVRGISFSGVNLDVTLEIVNPNLGSLEANTIKYEIAKASDQTIMAKDTLERKFVVPAGGTTDILVPMTFSYTGLGMAGMSLINKGTTKMTVSGIMVFEAPLARYGVVEIPFEGEAIITLEEEPPMK